MTTAFDAPLNESLRDAMLALYLHEVVPNDQYLIDQGLADRIKTPNEIYELWLLDVQVSQNVPTSPVACAIASHQQYIHGIFMNMEPGYQPGNFTPNQLESWRDEMSQYSLWAANQQLHYFPSNYLDPMLRLTKTESFKQLENDINQTQIQPDTVQTAVLDYLARLEEIANLRCLNGYIDGKYFANSIYYFIAKSPAENVYYWRSLDMRQRPIIAPVADPDAEPLKYDKPLPEAWSDWKRANVPISEKAIEHSIRPTWFNNRLFIFWAEVVFQDPDAISSSDKKVIPLFRLYGAYKKYDDTWSIPRVYIENYGTSDALRDPELNPNLIEKGCNTIAVYDHSTSPDTLFLALYYGYEAGGLSNGNGDSYDFLRTLRIDKNFAVMPMFPAVGYVEKSTGFDIKESEVLDLEEGHVRTVCHLFAHSADGDSRFQYWLPTGTNEFGEITTSSPSTPQDLWNYKGLQAKVKTLTEADVTYDRSDTTIKISSRMAGSIPDTYKVTISMGDGGREVVGFTLVFSSQAYSEWVDLLEGSRLMATNTGFYDGDYDFYTFNSSGDALSKLIVDWGGGIDLQLIKLLQEGLLHSVVKLYTDQR
ncbi:neuraminidase-like domain-containing protein [Pseudomonas sp. PAB10]|uniref:neuraminidase-like domain-containing protein n=1 Tax=Pseudomonas sp. PAB10 TaxID=3233047 RepID=UPI003F9C3A52